MKKIINLLLIAIIVMVGFTDCRKQEGSLVGSYSFANGYITFEQYTFKGEVAGVPYKGTYKTSKKNKLSLHFTPKEGFPYSGFVSRMETVHSYKFNRDLYLYGPNYEMRLPRGMVY